MEQVKIKIKGKAHPVKFGYGVSRSLGEKWGVAGILEVFQRAFSVYALDQEGLKELDLESVTDMEDLPEEAKMAFGSNILKFENIEMIAQILEAGVIKGSGLDELPVDFESFVDIIMDDFENSMMAFSQFLLTMPRTKEEKKKGNPTARKTRATGKKKA